MPSAMEHGLYEQASEDVQARKIGSKTSVPLQRFQEELNLEIMHLFLELYTATWLPLEWLFRFGRLCRPNCNFLLELGRYHRRWSMDYIGKLPMMYRQERLGRRPLFHCSASKRN